MFGLFSWFEDQLSGIISQVLQQVNVIQDSVTNPLKGIIGQVSGGIWKGDGANRFVDEMTNQVIPMLANIMTNNTNYANAIKKSQDRMAQAVQQATQAAQTLQDVFSNIF